MKRMRSVIDVGHGCRSEHRGKLFRQKLGEAWNRLSEQEVAVEHHCTIIAQMMQSPELLGALVVVLAPHRFRRWWEKVKDERTQLAQLIPKLAAEIAELDANVAKDFIICLYKGSKTLICCYFFNPFL